MICQSILALLSADDDEAGVVLARAVELAEQEHATLTLAALTGVSRPLRWLASLALLASGWAPTPEDLATFAQRRVAQAAEFVPTCVSVTTTVVDDPRRLFDSGRYDLVVLGARYAARRRLKHLTTPVLIVPLTGGSPRFAEAAAPAPLAMS